MNLTTHIQPTRDKERAYDGSAWPLAPLCTALDRLAGALLSYFLDPKSEPDPALWHPFRPRPGLRNRLFPGHRRFPYASEEPVGGFRDTLLRAAHRISVDRPILARDRLGRIWRRRTRRPARDGAALVRHTLNGYLSGEARGRLMTRGLADALMPQGTHLLPHHLWRTAGRLTFTAADFRLRYTRKLQQFLRARVLLDPARDPELTLAPQTFWLLIALYRPPRRGPWHRLRPSVRAHARLVADTAALAGIHARRRHWAGFWDQWLIVHALRRDPARLSNLDPMLQRALLQLPLAAACKPALPAPRTRPSDKPPIVLADPEAPFTGPGPLFQLYESHMWEVPGV